MAWWLLGANVFWTIAYDTAYAMVDRNDDVRIGIKTSAILFGRRAYVPHVSTYRAARVRISGRRPLPARADSIDMGVTPIECRVRPKALKVVVGPDFGAARAAP